MSKSDYVGLYGAVLSTLLAIWTIYRTIQQERVHLTITIGDYGLMVGVPGDPDFADPLFITQISVVNHSAFPVKVEAAGMHFSESTDGNFPAPFKSQYLEFGPTPRLNGLGYALPFTVQPRESGKSAAIKGGVLRYFKVNEKPRELHTRPFVRLADGSMHYGRWMKFTISEKNEGNLEVIPRRVPKAWRGLKRRVSRE